MLVLGRKVGEQIIVGDNIRVTVLGVCGSQVRLGIAAPAEVRVLRTEVWAQEKPFSRNASRNDENWVK